MQLQTHVRREGWLPASLPPRVGAANTWGRPFGQRDAGFLPALLSLCLASLFDTSHKLAHMLFKYIKLWMVKENHTLTHPWTQEKNHACQQYMNITSSLLKETSLLNSCGWPQEKLFNAYRYLGHPDLSEVVNSVLNDTLKALSYPDCNDGTGHLSTAAGGACCALYCSPVQCTAFPPEPSAPKEHLTIPVETLINLWFPTNKTT